MKVSTDTSFTLLSQQTYTLSQRGHFKPTPAVQGKPAIHLASSSPLTPKLLLPVDQLYVSPGLYAPDFSVSCF